MMDFSCSCGIQEHEHKHTQRIVEKQMSFKYNLLTVHIIASFFSISSLLLCYLYAQLLKSVKWRTQADQNPVVPRLGTGNPLNHFVGRHLGSMLQSNCCGHIGAAGISLTWHVLLLWPSSLLLIKHPSVLWNLFFCWRSQPNQIAKTRQSRRKTHTYRMESLW